MLRMLAGAFGVSTLGVPSSPVTVTVAAPASGGAASPAASTANWAVMARLLVLIGCLPGSLRSAPVGRGALAAPDYAVGPGACPWAVGLNVCLGGLQPRERLAVSG